jgi:non-specific serine/threonine protein kinase
LNALRRLAAYYEQAREWDLALDCVRRAVASDPLAEEAHCDLIRVLAESGQTAAALRQFRDMERLLATQLEAEPSQAAVVLIERIRQGNHGASAPTPPARRAIPPALPAVPTRFFGRESEMDEVQRLARPGGARFVTLIGAGGSGKTRLGLEAAVRLAEPYEGSVWFVPLADLSDGRLLLNTMVEAMRLPYAGNAPLDSLIEALTPGPSLLVLDNLEHIAAAARPLLRDLAKRLPALTILMTSRQRLGLEGEREILVPPLPLPETASTPPTTAHVMACASVQLFVDRAQAVQPSFRITPRNAQDVVKLCARLEGLPLAIELCAAWAQMLTPQQMLARLSRRFDLLVSRRADIAPRHRTLRAAIEYGYAHLPAELRRFFINLSVFQGGWNLEAAEAVCAATSPPLSVSALEALRELRERSFVVAEEADTEMRFRMLDTLRDFASEEIPPHEADQWQKIHAEYFVSLAEASEAHIPGSDQAIWLARLEVEHDNFRAALTWAASKSECEIGLRLAGALVMFWDLRGYLSEGQDWLDRILAVQGDYAPATRAKALTARGYLARNQGDSAAVDAAMQEAVQLWRKLGDERGLAECLQALATIAYSREDCDEAEAFLEEGLQIARRLGDRKLIARSQLNLGNLALEQGDFQLAWDRYTESLSLYRATDVSSRAAYALNNMGLVARYQGDLVAARRLLEESLALCRELGDRPGVSEALLNLGTVSRLAGKHSDARLFVAEAATLSTEIGEKRMLAWCAKETGHIASAEGRHATAVRMLAAAETLRQAMGISFKPVGPGEIERDLDLSRLPLGETGYAAAWAAGHGLAASQVYTEVLWLSRMQDPAGVVEEMPKGNLIEGWIAR